MTKSKRMKNNASSVVEESETMNVLKHMASDDNLDADPLVCKHKELRTSYLNGTKTACVVTTESPLIAGESEYENPPSYNNVNIHTFMINKDIEKTMARSNFPVRFPTKFNNDYVTESVMMQEEGQNLIRVANSNSKMTKVFIKFWNRFITKQDAETSSITDHQITEQEAAYFPCQLQTLFNSPECYVKKRHCEKIRYTGFGYQLLPSSNQFLKNPSRSLVKSEVKEIFDYYSEEVNQSFLIPIELSSKLSRCMRKSIEISQETEGCNKIKFGARMQQNFSFDKHPIFTIENKPSISLEILPGASLSLVDNFTDTNSSTITFTNQGIQRTLSNYPYLSHFLHRTDFWIDDFYVQCWHYSRYFCDKLDLGNRINNNVSILAKDSIFKYLTACSARICVAIKYWILNPEGATYFRCYCGQKIYDSKQDMKMLGKYPIGSAELYNYQQKIKEQDIFHSKHSDHKSTNHICACSEQFADHKLWMAHIFSTKLSDISKICPIFMYLFAKNGIQQNCYVCECSMAYSDYDFWSFWLHACNCHILKNKIKLSCCCMTKSKTRKRNISAGDSEPVSRKGTLKRKKASVLNRSKSVIARYNRANKDLSDESEGDNVGEECSSLYDVTKDNRSDNSYSSNKESRNGSEENWQTGDNLELPSQVSKDNTFTTKRLRNKKSTK